jgi:hypothetical protein
MRSRHRPTIAAALSSNTTARRWDALRVDSLKEPTPSSPIPISVEFDGGREW